MESLALSLGCDRTQHALEPVPGLTDFVVEAVSNAFGRLPDPVLLPAFGRRWAGPAADP